MVELALVAAALTKAVCTSVAGSRLFHPCLHRALTLRRRQVRVTRGKLASGSVVEPPAVLRERKWARPATDGPKDTAEAVRSKQTHVPAARATDAT